jgi:hypothetical protein
MSNARLLIIALALATSAGACSRDNGVTPLGTLADDLPGTWSQAFSIPGASTIVTLGVADTTVSGIGTYTIEAGQPGTIAVTGMITAGSTVDLDLTRSDGWIAHFRGTLVTRDSLSGYMWGHSTTMIGIGDPAPAGFHRVAH